MFLELLLIEAAMFDREEVVNFLINHGAKMDKNGAWIVLGFLQKTLFPKDLRKFQF